MLNIIILSLVAYTMIHINIMNSVLRSHDQHETP